MMCFHSLFHQRQTQPRSFRVVNVSRWSAVKLIKYFMLMLLRNSDPFVLHFYEIEIAIPSCFYGNIFFILTVLHRIINEVYERFYDGVPVAENHFKVLAFYQFAGEPFIP